MNLVKRLASGAVVAASLLGGTPAFAGIITTFAGGGDGVDPSLRPLQATSVALRSPTSLVVDAAGDIHFIEGDVRNITRLSGGVLTTRLVGAAVFAGALAIDAAGIIYYTTYNQVMKLDLSNNVTVVAGKEIGYAGDGGPALEAQLRLPGGLAVVGNDLLVSDTGNHRIRRISGGTITTVAGTGSAGSDGDGGPAISARIESPAGIVGDGAGGFYFVSAGTEARLRHVNGAGVMATRATLPVTDPQAIARDSVGNVYVAGRSTSTIYRVDLAGKVDVAPGISPGYLGWPYGVAIGPADEIYIADTGRDLIRKVAGGILTTIAGGGNPVPAYDGDGGPATNAVFYPAGVSVDSAGNVLVSDSSASVVRRIDTSNTISTFAGVGENGWLGDGGPAVAAWLYGPRHALTTGNTTYIADTYNNRIRRIDGAGTIATVAGNGNSFSGDGGPATIAGFGQPSSLAMDSAGNLYVATFLDRRVRRITPTGIVDTVAGNGRLDFFGDGGLATRAGVPASRIAVDGAGNLYVSGDNRVRRVDASGLISTIAGDGVPQSYGESGPALGDGGPATAARLYGAEGVALDPSGNVYIAESWGSRIRKVSPDGMISTMAGTGVYGFSGDGGDSATAQLRSPGGLAWHAPSSSLLVAEFQRVRRIAIADDTPAAFSFTSQLGVAPSGVAQSNVIVPAAFDVAAPISITGGEYSIGCNGTFTSAAGTFTPGQGVCVRHTASALSNATTTTALTIGGVKGLFASTTLPGPGSFNASPAPIDFGSRWVYYTLPVRPITITNTGATPLTVHSVTTAVPFSLTHDCTAPLAAAASCTAQVTFRPLAAGNATGAVAIQTTAGTQTVALSGVGSLSLTPHYYQSILGRAPDSGGQAFWDGESARVVAAGGNVNEAWYAMAMQFYYSAEYVARARDNTGYVTDLYLTFFNRAPDSGGLAYWKGQLDQGVPREAILAQFMFSPEFAAFTNNIFGPRTVRAEIDMVMDFYRGFLLRVPDSQGLSFWIQRFRAAQCGQNPATLVRAEAFAIASEFVASPEYAGRNRTDAQFVGDLYNAIMRRGGDAGGIQYWIAELASGRRTRANVLNAFVNQNQEFLVRVNRVAAEVCYSP